MKLPPHKAGLTISHNEHKNYYESIADYVEDRVDTFPNHDEYQKCVDANEIWEIQWYPETPVGFYRVAASTLELALEYANADKQIEG